MTQNENKNYITEELMYSKYVIMEERESQIDSDATISVEVGMRCPRCKTRLDAMGHGSRRVCPWCNLEMALYGNGLICKAQKKA